MISLNGSNLFWNFLLDGNSLMIFFCLGINVSLHYARHGQIISQTSKLRIRNCPNIIFFCCMNTSNDRYFVILNHYKIVASSLVWPRSWHFLGRQVKFNRFLVPNEHPERICLYLVRQLDDEPAKIRHIFTK